MKERKLTILLALLAALALVFAGACSDGSDEAASTENEGNIDDSNNNNNENNENNENNDDGDNVSVSDSLADKIKGTKWEYASNANVSTMSAVVASEGEATLGTVTLEFGSDGSTVTGTATWAVGNGSDGSVAHAGEISGTYEVDSTDGDTINVTLGTGDDAVKLPLKLDGTSYSESNGIVTINITTSSELTVGELSDASFDVTCNSETSGACGADIPCYKQESDTDKATVDIFGTSVSGKITASTSTFTCTETGSSAGS